MTCEKCDGPLQPEEVPVPEQMRRLEQARCVLCGHIHYPRQTEQAGRYNPLVVPLNFRGPQGWKLHRDLVEQAAKKGNTPEGEAMLYVMTYLRVLEKEQI